MSFALSVEGLSVALPTPAGPVQVVNGVDYRIGAGEVFGIAGESGSGKTVSLLALLGLLPPGARLSGRAQLGDRDLLALSPRSLRGVRGREVAMVFQDPMASLHPMLSIERQMTEHMREHLALGGRAARARACELLEAVRIPDPERALLAHPHQFSGGMRQRIAIAIALACKPRVLIADEPTTALDVTVQAGILRLLDDVRRESGMAIVLVTHDLGVMSAIADRLTILYSGRVVETGTTADVIRSPRHPYTAALLEALPDPEADRAPLTPIPGAPHAPQARPSGCAFHTRCRYVEEGCGELVPELAEVASGRLVACGPDPLATGGRTGPGSDALAADVRASGEPAAEGPDPEGP